MYAIYAKATVYFKIAEYDAVSEADALKMAERDLSISAISDDIILCRECRDKFSISDEKFYAVHEA
ncbi:MAG: hypothetical protein GY865_16135 [candidate division Zixibacteria bacterium]|nr:hypothetical protein [candidate division Zixibacteria bacterium]